MEFNIMHFKDSEEAWEGINEYLINNQRKVLKTGGAQYGTMMVQHDNLIIIDDCTLNKNFNFGKVLGYSIKKWSKLVNNYCNFNYLDLVKHEILDRESKRSRAYNYTYHFDNVHGSGKDCLISLTFTRRKGEENPVLYFHTRASEVTKRAPFDFLLVQRMVEYIYGKKQKVKLVWDIPYMFINLECFMMYVAYKGREIVKPGKKGYTAYQQKLLDKHQKWIDVDLETVKYKVHQRAARQVKAWAGTYEALPDVFVKECKLVETNKKKLGHIQKLDELL